MPGPHPNDIQTRRKFIIPHPFVLSEAVTIGGEFSKRIVGTAGRSRAGEGDIAIIEKGLARIYSFY